MKILLPRFARVPEFAARFLGEVKVTARLQHPNIVQVLDFDSLADGTPYFVMERLRGRTLRAALRDTRQRGKAWTPANTYAVAAQVAEGLYRAHSHVPSIVHRDIKPENLYLHRAESSFEAVVKVMDFGVASVVGECDRHGIGTPRYMAPEQVAGERISPQTDQYALALVIYEMLTGRLPWDVAALNASALAEARRHVAPAPASRFCPWLPAAIDGALLKALSKDPAARHDTVHGLLFELRGLQSIGDRSLATGDAHSTDPMVGTLADGGAAIREDDTFGRMPTPSIGWPSLGVSGLTAPSGVSVEFPEPEGRPTGGPAPRIADRADGERLAWAPLLPRTASAANRLSAPTLAPEDRELPDSHPIETPITGESGRGSELDGGAKPSRRSLRALARATLGSGALVAVLVGAAAGGSPLDSRSNAVKPTEGEAWIARAAASYRAAEPAIAGPPPAPQAVDARRVDDWVVIPPLGPPPDRIVAKTTSASSGGGAVSAPARKAASSSRPTMHAAPTKAPVPDDGRDELYVPGLR
jgi:serine/threonine-protein kinase